MGKRGNENAQVTKEDYEASQRTSSPDAPKGPFAKASADVMKGRRIVRGRKSAIRESSTPSAAPGNSVFSGVELAAPGGSATAPGGGSNPFGGFSFGSSAASTTVPAASKPTAYPSFAMPAAASTKPPTGTATAAISKHSEATEEDKERIKCAQKFLEHVTKFGSYDTVAGRRFACTFAALGKSKSSTTVAAKPPPKATTTNWEFGGKSSVALSASPPAAPLFGAASAPSTGGFSFKTTNNVSASPAGSGGFSFNPTNTLVSAAPVPAFSFSTTPTPAVKAAAEAAATETSAKAETGAGEGENKDDDADGVHEAADNPFKVLYKTDTKILRVEAQKYVAKGVLKLEEHKKTKKNRLVVRDKAVGRVQMNVAITKGMPISKNIVAGAKNKKPTPIVLINAVFDEESGGPELFKIITKMEDHEKLFDELSKIV